MKSCNPLEKIEPAFDRFMEAHFWIHQLEDTYHYADKFRWCLNAYLKSIKEIPLLLSVKLQNTPGFTTWYKPHREQLLGDKLLNFLSEKRDFVVHRGMFVPNSHGEIGITEGRNFKLGIKYEVSSLEDSDTAMSRFLNMVAVRPELDFMGILVPDDDSEPCIHRVWRLPEFKEDVLELTSQAWLRTGKTLNEVVHWLGGQPKKLALDCRRSAQKINFKLYNRNKLNEEIVVIRRKIKRCQESFRGKA